MIKNSIGFAITRVQQLHWLNWHAMIIVWEDLQMLTGHPLMKLSLSKTHKQFYSTLLAKLPFQLIMVKPQYTVIKILAHILQTHLVFILTKYIHAITAVTNPKWRLILIYFFKCKWILMMYIGRHVPIIIGLKFGR